MAIRFAQFQDHIPGNFPASCIFENNECRVLINAKE